jgi:Copper type II ascorbate-dependent monooxygenase, C-terminal domain
MNQFNLRLGTLLITGLVGLCGCGSEVTVGGSGEATTSGGNATDEWTKLVDGTWQMTAGKEGYWCTRKTIEKDTYVKAFRAQAPLGTHHTLLLVTQGGVPDGEESCGPLLGANMIFASGIGTEDLVFPEGVAVKIPAGSQLLLNLHLFNTSSKTIGGVSGIEMKTMNAADMNEEAEMIFGGPTNINIPPNGSQVVEGSCIFPGTTNIWSVWAHMHQYGTNMKITHQSASGPNILHNGPYSFEEQINYLIEPVKVYAGEELLIECTYQNPTSQTVTWGDSSNSEMCFAGFYRYPKLGKGCF